MIKIAKLLGLSGLGLIINWTNLEDIEKFKQDIEPFKKSALSFEKERLEIPKKTDTKEYSKIDIGIGVEITEAISQQYAAYCALAEREFPGVFLEPAHFRWDSPDRTVEEVRTLLRQTQLTSDGWAGDHPEREWALFMQSAVSTKLEKLAHPDFMKCEQNWLSIYDNLPMPNIFLADAIGFLRPLLEDCWSRTPGFDTLFIEHGPVIARITSRGSDHLILKDLWK